MCGMVALSSVSVSVRFSATEAFQYGPRKYNSAQILYLSFLKMKSVVQLCMALKFGKIKFSRFCKRDNNVIIGDIEYRFVIYFVFYE